MELVIMAAGMGSRFGGLKQIEQMVNLSSIIQSMMPLKLVFPK